MTHEEHIAELVLFNTTREAAIAALRRASKQNPGSLYEAEGCVIALMQMTRPVGEQAA